MKRIIQLSALALPLIFGVASCSDNETTKSTGTVQLGEKLPTTDQLEVKVEGGYIEYGSSSDDDLAKAVMNRHTQGKVSADQTSLKSVIVAGNSLTSLSDQDYTDIVKYILTDKTLLVVDPTMANWNSFATKLVKAYTALVEAGNLPQKTTAAGNHFFRSLTRDVRTNLKDDIYGLPIVKVSEANENDVFASMLFVRGNKVRNYDHDCYDHPTTVVTETVKRDKDGNAVSTETSEPQTNTSENHVLNGFQTGQMADDVASNIDEAADDGANSDSNDPSDLKSLMQAQKFSHVFRVTRPIDLSYRWQERSCLVKTDYNIWAVYDFDHQTDYYLVHQTITSQNGDLHCSDGHKDWEYWLGDDLYFGTWAGDVYSTVNLLDEQGNAVSNVSVVNPQPATHQGATSYSSGMSWSLSGNAGLNTSGPSGGVGGSVSFSESYSTSAPDYAVELNASGSEIKWKFVASNSRIVGHFAWAREDATHDVVPACYRNNCTFNQSFIYTVQNPASPRYVLDVYAKQCLLDYKGTNSWFYMTDNYTYYSNEAKYQVVLNPPTRYKQDWYMTIEVPQGINQNDVRTFLQSHYPKYWKETTTCYTFTKDDTLPIIGWMNDFQNDIKNDLASWKNAGFTGKYSISVHPSNSSEVTKTIEFTVE